MTAAFMIVAMLLTVLPAAAICESACHATWNEPTTNADGSPLTDLAGYRLYLNGVQYGSDVLAASRTPPSGSIARTTIGALHTGSYSLNVTSFDLSNNESGHSAPVAFATGSPTVISISVAAGGVLTATWSGITAPTSTDWIGLYAVGTADRAYLAWIYVSCSQAPSVARASGSCAFQIPSVTPGIYEFRLYAADVYTRLATGDSFQVTP